MAAKTSAAVGKRKTPICRRIGAMCIQTPPFGQGACMHGTYGHARHVMDGWIDGDDNASTAKTNYERKPLFWLVGDIGQGQGLVRSGQNLLFCGVKAEAPKGSSAIHRRIFFSKREIGDTQIGFGQATPEGVVMHSQIRPQSSRNATNTHNGMLRCVHKTQQRAPRPAPAINRPAQQATTRPQPAAWSKSRVKGVSCRVGCQARPGGAVSWAGCRLALRRRSAVPCPVSMRARAWRRGSQNPASRAGRAAGRPSTRPACSGRAKQHACPQGVQAPTTCVAACASCCQ